MKPQQIVGMMIIQQKQIVSYQGDLEDILTVSPEQAIGKPLHTMIKDQHIVTFLLSNKGETNQALFVINEKNVQIKKYVNQSDLSIVATFAVYDINSSSMKSDTTVGFDNFLTNRTYVKEYILLAKKLANSEYPILIKGDTGTGKNFIARCIHHFSSRNLKPFIKVDCHSLMDNEQAITRIKEAYNRAHGGTLLLNNITDLSLKTQAELVVFLDEMGESAYNKSEEAINVRLITITDQQQLLNKTENILFRKDLLYRINVLPLHLPPLRYHTSDIEVFLEHFINKKGLSLKIDQAVIDTLKTYHWKGNIRELKNYVEYIVTVCNGKSVQLHDLPKAHMMTEKEESKFPSNQQALSIMEMKEYLFILEEIKEFNDLGEPASRRKVFEQCKKKDFPLTNQQIRHRLDFLEENEFITKGKGRQGTKITAAGIDFFVSLKNNLKTG